MYACTLTKCTHPSHFEDFFMFITVYAHNSEHLGASRIEYIHEVFYLFFFLFFQTYQVKTDINVSTGITEILIICQKKKPCKKLYKINSLM